MEKKYTPGLWTCIPISPIETNNNRGFEIRGFETRQSIRDVLEHEIPYNAALISAAPDLLLACEAIREAETRKEIEQAKRLAITAIKKALNQ